MKRADIKAGVVYGHYEGRDPYHVSPWLVLDSEIIVARPHGDSPYSFERAKSDEKMTSGRDYRNRAAGLPVVALMFNDDDLEEYNRKLARVLELASLEDMLSRTIPEGESRGWGAPTAWIEDGVNTQTGETERLGYYMYLTNGVHLHGDYCVWQDMKRARNAESTRIANQREEERLARLATYRALETRLAALGIKPNEYVGDHSDPGSVKLGFEDMAQLLDLIDGLGHELAAYRGE